MKVLFVIHSHQAGGAERHLVQLMHGLAGHGVECIYAGPCDSWLGEQLGKAGFRCVPIAFRGMFDVVSLLKLVSFVHREKIDLVHAHLSRAAFYAGWAAKLTSTPNVATAHLMDAGLRFGRTTRIIAVCNAVSRYLATCGYPADIVRTVHNGVPDYTALAAVPAAQFRAGLRLGDAPVVTMVARIEHVKGHDIALQAFARLRDKPWTLLLAGSLDTPWAKKMQALATDLGIGERVRFIGHRDDIPSIYRCTDIVIAPSRREAFSLTLLEASSFSLPVVASNVDGNVEAVADGETGILVPPEDPESLAKAVVTLLDDASLRRRMGVAGRRRFEQRFSVGTMIQGVLDVYKEAETAAAKQRPIKSDPVLRRR